jgi:hypothetical protein
VKATYTVARRSGISAADKPGYSVKGALDWFYFTDDGAIWQWSGGATGGWKWVTTWPSPLPKSRRDLRAWLTKRIDNAKFEFC